MLLLPQNSVGIGTAALDIGDIQGSGWSAQGIRVEWLLKDTDGVSARITATRMKLDTMPHALERLVVNCPRPEVKPPHFRCANAHITGHLGPLGRQNLRADVTYHSARGSLDFDLRNLKLAGGALHLKGQWRPAGWHAVIDAQNIALIELTKLAAPWFKLPEGFVVDGRSTINATIRGSNTVHSAEAKIALSALTANNAEGTLATDQLAMEIEARLKPVAQGWSVEATVKSASGQAYSDPIFVDMGKHPLQATLKGQVDLTNSTLTVETLEVNQQNIAQLTLTGELAYSQPPYARNLDVALSAMQFPGAYTVLMQPFLLDSELKDLTTTGQVAGSVSIVADEPSAIDLQLQNITARDAAGKMGIDGLSGHLVWSSKDRPSETPSQLTWKSANAYGLSGTGTRLDFITSGANFRLLQPTIIPVLDGGLSISTLSAQNIGEDAMSLRFEGELRPIGMPLLSKAFGWPEFSGTLAGKIPEVSYDEGVLSVGGTLEAQAFGGRLTVEGLELRDPLGTYPRLKADITLRNLDLQAVTGTFSFGTITGLLDGEIRDLELFRWTPVRMDARLYTSPNDKSRHLISQRAVKNLSSIGGGGGSVAATLQSGFLRFFENFRYQKLGLSCRLENEVCHMEGVGRAKGDSYYIVKGSGVPRIDIIGNARRVNWPVLLEQLKTISESEGPVVQ